MNRKALVGFAALAVLALLVWRLFTPALGPGEAAPEAVAATAPVERDASGRWHVRAGLVHADLPSGELRIVGRVVDAKGPVSDAIVTATAGTGADVLSNMDCQCDMHCGQKLLECGCGESASQLEALVSAREGEAPPVASATTGEDGSFVLEGLAAADVTRGPKRAREASSSSSERPRPSSRHPSKYASKQHAF